MIIYTIYLFRFVIQSLVHLIASHLYLIICYNALNNRLPPLFKSVYSKKEKTINGIDDYVDPCKQPSYTCNQLNQGIQGIQANAYAYLVCNVSEYELFYKYLHQSLIMPLI